MKRDILSEIVANKRHEVERQKQAVSPELLSETVERLREEESEARAARSMSRSLAESPTGIIAEFKRRSPSKGWIHREARPAEVIPAYERAGASALSILTDEAYFGGTLADIRAARPLTRLPILRKEFVVDEYQLLQARAVGADAVLLIASVLSREECGRLVDAAHSLGLETLLEIHGEEELPYADLPTDMVGVNNRHLGSFVTDPSHSLRVAGLLPAGKVLVSESGLSDPQTVARLRRAGYRGFLIGEAFMRSPLPGEALRAFAEGIRSEAGKEARP